MPIHSSRMAALTLVMASALFGCSSASSGGSNEDTPSADTTQPGWQCCQAPDGGLCACGAPSSAVDSWTSCWAADDACICDSVGSPDYLTWVETDECTPNPGEYCCMTTYGSCSCDGPFNKKDCGGTATPVAFCNAENTVAAKPVCPSESTPVDSCPQ
ncbi:MAG TPA: hypothetical protein VHS09_03905 [Polyangiaceae bacterium]|nr:hypothetical protein [Polyangiaceae bacterium]